MDTLASHSLMSLPHVVQRSSSGLTSAGDIPAATAAATAASLKLLLDVTEICDVSEERREWPLCSEFIDFTSVSISLEGDRYLTDWNVRMKRRTDLVYHGILARPSERTT